MRAAILTRALLSGLRGTAPQTGLLRKAAPRLPPPVSIPILLCHVIQHQGFPVPFLTTDVRRKPLFATTERNSKTMPEATSNPDQARTPASQSAGSTFPPKFARIHIPHK